VSKGQPPAFAAVTAWVNSQSAGTEPVQAGAVLVSFGTCTCINRVLCPTSSPSRLVRGTGAGRHRCADPPSRLRGRPRQAADRSQGQERALPVAVGDDSLGHAFDDPYWPAAYFVDTRPGPTSPLRRRPLPAVRTGAAEPAGPGRRALSISRCRDSSAQTGTLRSRTPHTDPKPLV
jgi:hypothetical protein